MKQNIFIAFLVLLFSSLLSATTYDTVIENGRVINPETGLDQTGLNVGIQNGTVSVITNAKLKGKQVIDATGLVVAPGFIDNLSYNPNRVGVWRKIGDGITANFLMHGGSAYPEKWYKTYKKQGEPLHYGISFFYSQARYAQGLSRYAHASSTQISNLLVQAENALNAGCMGISFSLEYLPGITTEEIRPFMYLAHRYNVPTYFHARYSDVIEPGTELEGVKELLDLVEESGAAVHIDHLHSTGGTFVMPQALKMINQARAKGLDITAGVYPYNYWGTYLNSARFDHGWQDRFRISYHDLQISGTPIRLTKPLFNIYQKKGALAVAYAIPESSLDLALKQDWIMFGSDAILEPGYNNHPRASGAACRLLGLYVREKKLISLMHALRMLTILPARRLEKQVPALRKKGRLAPGMDADIVVFNSKTIRDRSTVEHPELYSKGMEWVLVSGVVVKSPKKIYKNRLPGKAIRSHFDRVQTARKTLISGKTPYPLVQLGTQLLINVGVLVDNGFSLKTNSLTLELTPNRRKKPSSTPRFTQGHTEHTLILTRGWKLKSKNQVVELFSIKDDLYMPLAKLKNFGYKLKGKSKIRLTK